MQGRRKSWQLLTIIAAAVILTISVAAATTDAETTAANVTQETTIYIPDERRTSYPVSGVSAELYYMMKETEAAEKAKAAEVEKISKEAETETEEQGEKEPDGEAEEEEPEPETEQTAEEPAGEPESVRTFTADEERELKQIGVAEGEGEGALGQAFVMMVVLNREKSEQFPNSIHDVIFQPGQFSPVSSDGRYYSVTPNSDTEEAFEMIKSGWDSSEGALYFESCKGTSWHEKHLTLLFRYGCHNFYK